MGRQSLMRDIVILLLIGLIGELIFGVNLHLIRKTRWGGV